MEIAANQSENQEEVLLPWFWKAYYIVWLDLNPSI